MLAEEKHPGPQADVRNQFTRGFVFIVERFDLLLLLITKMREVKKLPWKWSNAILFITPPAALGILVPLERLHIFFFFIFPRK